MAMIRELCFMFFFALLSIQQHCSCADSPENSPSPAPVAGGDLGSLPPTKTQSSSPSPSPSPLANVNSPVPSPADGSPNSAPEPSPGNATPSPSPAPSDVVVSDISHESTMAEENGDDGGMDGGKKAGVAFGVIAAVCVLGLGALVYKKRRQNIRRAQFGYAARRDFL